MTAHADEPDTEQGGMLGAPVARALLLLAAPISASMLSTFVFQAVDTYFVGQLGPAELAALGFAATAYFLCIGLFMGFAVGVSSLVGSSLGADDRQAAQRYTTVAAVFATLVSALLCGLGVLTIDPLFGALGAGPELLPLIREYMTVLYCGMPLLVFGLVANAAIGATGDVNRPALIMGIAGVINLVFDYLLIFGIGPFPELKLTGAALATVGSWAFVLLGMLVLLLRKRLLTTKSGDLRVELTRIYQLSSPAVATQVLLPVTAMFITTLVARTGGADSVAAFGVAARIETLILVGISSVSVAIVPFIAQNHGAREKARVEKAIVFAGKASFYWGGAAALVLVAFAGPIAGVFTTDAEVLGTIKLYFYIVAFSYAPYGLVTMTAAIFNGVQIPRTSLQVLAVKSLVITLPAALIGARFGVAGVFAAIAISNVLGAMYAGRVMRRSLREHQSPLADARPIDDYMADWRALAGRVRGRSVAPGTQGVRQ